MEKMTRKQALDAMRGAGATNNKQAFARLYVENRISLVAANRAWADGQNLMRFVTRRDDSATEAGWLSARHEARKVIS